jgi:hypothetical protein
LQRSASGWKLEFQQLVYNTPSLLRPRRFAVQGEQAILQQLRELSGHEPLARDTERLFARGALPEGSYVVRDDRWFPEIRPEPTVEPEPQLTAAGVEGGGKNPLEELTKRIAALETTVRGLQQVLEVNMRGLTEALASGRLAAPPAPPAAAAAAARAGAAEPAAASPATAATAAHGDLDGPDDLPPAAAEAAPEADERKVIGLPALSSLSDLVRSLAGPEAVLSTTERIDWKQVGAQQPVFCAVIQDNGGDEAASMIFDLESALRLAGALLMESEEMIASLLEEKVMSDEMLDAASEVCNTLTSSFNKVSGNPHLRAGKMQPLSEARLAELARARKRDDYRYSQGGRLSMIAR